jgi:N-acetylhexosamine 1-kinase
MDKNAIETILNQFTLPTGQYLIEPIKSGRINQTYLVNILDRSSHVTYRYILQSINTKVFKEPQIIMNNMELLVNFHPIPGLALIRTLSGKLWLKTFDDKYYRLTRFVENVEPSQFELSTILEAGRAVGEFHQRFLSFPVQQLTPVIDGFHHTPTRVKYFFEILSHAPVERVTSAKEEINFFKEYTELAGVITTKLEDLTIPYRVTHNDTKIDNILFNDIGKAICLIDFDTVMPGAIAWDVGDSIRSMANMVDEEERNIEKVRFCIDHFIAFIKGYASVMDGYLTVGEVESLIPGCFVISYEQGLRFLTDYLNCDQYYPINYYNQNLVRAKVQIEFLKQLMAHQKAMETGIKNQFSRSLGRG